MTQERAQFSETLRSRGFSICLHVGLWVLVFMVLYGSRPGEDKLPFSATTLVSSPAAVPVPVARVMKIFGSGDVVRGNPAGTNQGFFATTYFVPRTPPPPPPVAPPPPPPTTWKLELSYQGFYRTGDGPKFAVVRMGDKLVNIQEGAMLVTNLYVVDATMRTLMLTNSAVQTNVLALNAKQAVEVPLK